MYKFFGIGINENNVALAEEDIHHIINVLRLSNEEFDVVFEGNIYRSHVVRTKPVIIEWTEKNPYFEKNSKLFIALSLTKGDKLDLALQKCTELGVDGFYLFESSRCIVKFSKEQAEKKIERFKKIVKEASQQSKRNSIPEVEYIGNMNNILLHKKEVNLVAYENAPIESLNYLKLAKNSSSLVLVGPEGGFSLNEIESLTSDGFLQISLGTNILRAETAPIYIASVISFLKEENSSENL